MTDTLTFTVYGTARAAGSKRAFTRKGGGVGVEDSNAKALRPWVAALQAEAASHVNGSLLDGPLAFALTFYMPRPKGHYGTRGLLPSAPVYPTVKPDVLKLARGVEDALTGIVYRDDAQIVSETLDKRYGEPARVEVRVQPL